MTHETAFWDAIAITPQDPAPRLVYADWLEERGEPSDLLLAAFLRRRPLVRPRRMRRRRLLTVPPAFLLSLRHEEAGYDCVAIARSPFSRSSRIGCRCNAPGFLLHRSGVRREDINLYIACRWCGQRWRVICVSPWRWPLPDRASPGRLSVQWERVAAWPGGLTAR